MTTRLLIEHGSVLTMNDNDDLIEDGAVLIEDDRIVDVGTTEDVRSRHDLEGVRVIDATDKAVLPGLVDLHFHTAIGRAGRIICRSGSTSTPVGTRSFAPSTTTPRTGQHSPATWSRSSAASRPSMTCIASSGRFAERPKRSGSVRACE